MPCPIIIRETIEASIDRQLPDRNSVMAKNVATKIVKYLNKVWSTAITRVQQYSGDGGYKVFVNDLEIAINREYNKQLDFEKNAERDLNFFKDDKALYEQETKSQDDLLLQKSEAVMLSKAPTPKTLAMIKEFINKIGVDIKVMQNISVNGISYDANGAALLMQKLIAVVEGKEEQALPEEAMHFAVAIIKQTNPTLYKKLLSEINGSQTLKDVIAGYGNDPLYQIDGKPNVAKLKEEAIGKLLAEKIINGASIETNETDLKIQNWWTAIKDWLKSLFKTSAFDQVAMDIITGKFEGTADDIREQQDSLFLQKDPQAMIYDNLIEISKQIEKPDSAVKDSKYKFNGKEIKKRVSDFTKDFYDRRRSQNELLDTEYDKALAELKAEKGTKGHTDLENAFSLFVDENGFLRSNAVLNNIVANDNYTSQIDPNDSSIYITLRNNLLERLRKFEKESPGTRFLKEIVIYDSKRSLAGTIDFMAITKEGKVHILDWKFMGLNLDRYTAIPWYKVASWRIQMNQYKSIVQNNYGVPSENFGETRMIPILAVWSKGKPKINVLPELIKIKIGDVEVQNIPEDQDYLIPVGVETEKTGNTRLDALIDRLNRAYEKFSDTKAFSVEDKKNKADQLNALFTAIMKLHMKKDVVPLLAQATILHNQINELIEVYKTKYKNTDPKKLTDDEIDEFIVGHENAAFAIDSYTDLYNELKTIIDTTDTALVLKIRGIADDSRDFKTELDAIQKEFVSDIIAKREGFDFFNMAEKTVRGLSRLFSSTATLQVKSIQLLYKKASKALGFAAFDTQTESARLTTLRDEYQKWTNSVNLVGKDFFKPIKKKDSNELIDQYKKEFYSELKKNSKDKESADFSWIKANIEIPEYRAHIDKKLNEEIDRIKNKHRGATKEENDKAIANEVRRAISLYDLSKNDSIGWLLYDEVKKFPKKSVWESDEWKFLSKPENIAAKNFYDYIVEKNTEYAEIGYVSKRDARVFLPYVRKSMVERVLTGDNIQLGREFLESISVDEGDVGFGQIDPATGIPVRKIPKYFTTKLDEVVSEDLFKTIAMYNEMAIRYKYLTKIEAQLRAVALVEKNRQSINTSAFGKARRKDGKIDYIDDNRSNSDLYNAMMDSIIYGQKYVQSDLFDSTLGRIGSLGTSINEKLGMKIFPEDLSDRQITVNKIVDNLNRSFQLTSLGLNVLSATSNFFGGNAQSLINAGTYFTKTDYIKAETQLFVNKFNKTAGGNTPSVQMFAGALEYFLPLTDNYNREIAKRLSLNSVTQQGMQDVLMFMMRNADFAVQTSNFYAYLNNSIVVDNEVVNVRQYLRSLPEYANKYSGSAKDRAAFNAKFESEIKRLLEEKSVMKLAKITNGKFEIPGVERLSDSVIDIRRKVQQLTKDALGNLSEDDVRMINMNILTKSMMVFKNWIPRLVDVRLGEFKYNAASDAYEWGRLRTIFSLLHDNLFTNIGALSGLLGSAFNGTVNDKSIELIRKSFEKLQADHFEQTGETLQLTEEIFIDLVRKNIRAAALDAIVTLLMISMVAVLKANTPDDEEYPAVINQYRFLVKAADKLKDELTYFWDPTSFGSIVRGGLFPSMTLIENGTKTIKNFFIENYAIGVDDKELEKSNKVIKYAMKSFPFTNQMAGYLPMFYPEIAKDLGITIQSNYGTR